MQPTKQPTQKTQTKTALSTICEHVENGVLSPDEGNALLNWLDSKTQSSNYNNRKLIGIMVQVKTRTNLNLCAMDSKSILSAVGIMERTTPNKNYRQKVLTTFKNYVSYTNDFVKPIIQYNVVMRRIKPGSPNKNAKTIEDLISAQEFAGIFERCALSPFDKALLMFLWNGALRPSEAYKFRWCDVKTTPEGVKYIETIDKPSIGVKFKTGKSGKVRVIKISDNTLMHLEVYRDHIKADWSDEGWIFPRMDGSRYTSLKQMRATFERIRKEAGLRVFKPSTVRNSALSYYAKTQGIEFVSKIGWGDEFNDTANYYVRTNSLEMQIESESVDIPVLPSQLRGVKTLTVTEDQLNELVRSAVKKALNER